MGRRKKELLEFHRGKIIEAAELLFEEKGIEKTTMDDIARNSEYSKATLYVYFKNKEEIVNCIILDSMRQLYERIRRSADRKGQLLERYDAICMELSDYYEQYPLYFSAVSGEISIDIEKEDTLPVQIEIFETGEKINQVVSSILKEGMAEGLFREDMDIPQTVFYLWFCLAGLIQMADAKKQYIEQVMGVTKRDFLAGSFRMLLRSIQRDN